MFIPFFDALKCHRCRSSTRRIATWRAAVTIHQENRRWSAYGLKQTDQSHHMPCQNLLFLLLLWLVLYYCFHAAFTTNRLKQTEKSHTYHVRIDTHTHTHTYTHTDTTQADRLITSHAMCVCVHTHTHTHTHTHKMYTPASAATKERFLLCILLVVKAKQLVFLLLLLLLLLLHQHTCICSHQRARSILSSPPIS